MKNPLIFFGAVTGNPSKEEIKTALLQYRQNGMDNFIVYPRDGCDVPYMSDSFIEMCKTYIEYAAELGINIILYDEYNWPSGSCKGAVQRENSKFCAKYITKDGEIKENPAYADILNPLAVDCFIEKTHEVYYRHFGKYFGSVIKGIFSDEPSFAHFAVESGAYPYNETAAKRYCELVGRELVADIKDGTFVSNIYFQILGDLFCEVFIGKIRDWCDRHGILMTGHLLGEGDAYSSARSNGNVIKALRCFSMPGIDEIFTDTDIDSTQFITYGSLQAAVRNTNKDGLCEIFALGPTDMPFSRMDQMIWLVSMFGVSKYTLAIAPLDIRGNVKKNGYFFPTNYIQPWFCGISDFAESAGLASEYAKKKIRADVGVLVPFSLCADGKGEKIIAKNIQKLLSLLTKNQYQWILVTEGDDTGGLEIIDAAKDGFSPEKAVASLHKRADLVTDESGDPAKDILFREYTDATCVILDMSDSDESKTVYYRGQKLTLCGRGHIALPNKSEEYEYLQDVAKSFEITCQSPNTLRCNFKNDGDEFVFTCENDIENVKLLVRNYAFEGTLFLDKKEVSAKKVTDALTLGMSALYNESESFTLCKGKHTVKLTKRTKSEPFFPSCLIAGKFSANDKDCIKTLESTVGPGRLDKSVLHQYSGKIGYECDATVPYGAGIRMSCFGLYTRLYIDGEYLGGKFSGYIWDIPEKYQGKKVRIRIEQYTSIAPMLGRARDVIKDGDGEWWAPIEKWFGGRYAALGIEKLEFVKKIQN